MSKELSKTYDPKDIEDRLYKKWEDNGYFHAEVDRSKKPFTIVMPPPNITGQLHMGHALDNTMQDILIRFGFRVDAVASGQEALDCLVRAAQADTPYSLVLLDWKMPGMNGMEVADSIHKLPLESIPHLLMISAHGLEAYREKGENLHFAGFLVKPVNPVTLWSAILKVLGKSAAPPLLADMDGAGNGGLS